jgi:hypothetical protein
MIKAALSALIIFLAAQGVSAADAIVPDATTNSAAPPVPPPLVVPATTRAEAERETLVKIGRHDPFAPFGSDSSKFAKKGNKFRDLQKGFVPPPPPGTSAFAPVPSPSEGSLAISELPLPPSRPSLTSKLKLSAVFDNRAIFTIPDLAARRFNKWPKVVRLGLGDNFNSVKLVAVGVDSATLEEDGLRSVKELEPLK